MLANSDFFTGAFPAEYGNAMSGVFDIRLRNGNNEKHEHAFQLGALGLDVSSEGPFSKNSRASYLFNYRYSTFGIIKPILPEEANIPIYQDLCLKVNVPTKSFGNFSLWALGADNKIKFETETDTSQWSYNDDRMYGGAKQRMGAIGINHRYIIGSKTYLSTSYALSGDYTIFKAGFLSSELIRSASDDFENLNYKNTFTSAFNHKFSARHTNRTGIELNNLHHKNILRYAPSPGENLTTAVDENSSSNLYRIYSQSKLTISDRFGLNIGINTQYLELNNEFVIEPRAGITYRLTNRQSLSLAYGKHSRLEPISVYFARIGEGPEANQPNKQLRLSKAHHFIFAYDLSINSNMRLKIEPYAQLLYDIPVISDSSYSTINMEADWIFTDVLNNSGTGTNVGIDVTFERFLHNGYYYLLTTSLFESTYVGGDGIKRNTRFNTNYIVNLLLGKEWTIGTSGSKILGINGRLNLLGGQRQTPVDESLTYKYGKIVYDYSRTFEDQKPMVYHLNASITYRNNKKKHSSIWALQVMNLLGTEEFYGYDYNYRTETVDRIAVRVVVPSISYKIEF